MDREDVEAICREILVEVRTIVWNHLWVEYTSFSARHCLWIVHIIQEQSQAKAAFQANDSLLLLQSTCSIQFLLEPCEAKQFSIRFMPGHHVGQADFLDRRRELFVWGVYVRWTAGRRYYDVSSFWAVFRKLSWAFHIAGINRSDIRLVKQDGGEGRRDFSTSRYSFVFMWVPSMLQALDGRCPELETNKSFRHLNMKCMEVLRFCVFWNIWMNCLLFECYLNVFFVFVICLAFIAFCNDESRPLPTGLVFSSFMTCMSLGSSATCGAGSLWKAN